MKYQSYLWGVALIASLSNIGEAAAAKHQNTAPSAAEKAPMEAPVAPGSRFMPFRTSCYTNDSSCAGWTKIGGFNYAVGCSIWWNNGAAGRTNLTLQAGATQDYYVRYNDTGACIAIQYAPPHDSPRYYLWVYR